MSPIALALVGVGALAHTGWNLAAKRSAGSGLPFVFLSSVVAMLVVTPFAVGSYALGPTGVLVTVGAGVVSGLIHIAYFLLLQQGYRSGDVSLVYPMARGTGPLLSMVASVVLLAERPGGLGLAGGVVVVAGVAVIGFAGSRGVDLEPAAVGYGLLTGVTIACYTIWDSYSVTTLDISPLVQSGLSSLTEVVVLLPLAGRAGGLDRRVVRRDLRAALIVGIGSPMAYIAIMYAMRHAPTALVAPGREVSVVLVSIAGWLLFKEPNPLPRLLGATVVLTGIVCLAIG